MQTHPLYIGGETVETDSKRTIPLPYDGSAVAVVQEASAAIVDRAGIALWRRHAKASGQWLP